MELEENGYSLTFSPDGKYCAYFTFDGPEYHDSTNQRVVICTFDEEQGRVTPVPHRTIRVHRIPLFEFSPDGEYMLTLERNFLEQYATPQREQRLQTRDRMIAYLSGLKHDGTGLSQQIYSLTKNGFVGELREIKDLVNYFDPDDRRYVMPYIETHLYDIPSDRGNFEAKYSPDGRYIVVCGRFDNTYCGIYDLKNRVMLDTGWNYGIRHMEFSPCGRYLAMVLTQTHIHDEEVRIFNVDKNFDDEHNMDSYDSDDSDDSYGGYSTTLLDDYVRYRGNVRWLSFSPNNENLCIAEWSNINGMQIKVFKFEYPNNPISGDPIFTLEELANHLSEHVKYSTCGRYIVTGGMIQDDEDDEHEGFYSIYDIASGERIVSSRTIPQINKIRFSPGGKYIIFGFIFGLYNSINKYIHTASFYSLVDGTETFGEVEEDDEEEDVVVLEEDVVELRF